MKACEIGQDAQVMEMANWLNDPHPPQGAALAPLPGIFAVLAGAQRDLECSCQIWGLAR